MNFLDIIILILLAWGAYTGFRKGFVIELATLAALILGIYLAINFSWYAAGFLADNFSLGDKAISIIAFVLTFVVVVLVVHLIGKIIEKFINLILLGFLNRLAGLFFGIIKWAFLLSVILYIIHVFDEKDRFIIKEEWRQESMLYESIESFAPYIIPKLNLEKFKEFTRPLEEELKEV